MQIELNNTVYLEKVNDQIGIAVDTALYSAKSSGEHPIIGTTHITLTELVDELFEYYTTQEGKFCTPEDIKDFREFASALTKAGNYATLRADYTELRWILPE